MTPFKFISKKMVGLFAALAFLVGLFAMPFYALAAPLRAINSYSASNDGTNVYYTLNYSSTYSFYRVYIDTDQNAGTGFNTNGIGANYLLENNNLYSSCGTGWCWTFIKTVTYTNSAGVVNWTVARSDIGETANPNSANLVFQVESPLTTGGIYTHTYSGSGPTNTPTSTNTPVVPTATNTPVGPTATFTNTPVAPTATFTATATSQPGTCARFVATTGNDANNGLTIDAPWRTVQKAASSAQAGNVVCIRGGSYNERVTVNVSGSAAGGYITFQSYPGETAVLDGTGLAVASGWSPMLMIQNKSYVIIKGLEVRNHKSSVASNEPIGIFVTGYGDHIELRNNKVHGIWNTVANGNAHGIAVYGTNATSSINNIILDGNEVYDLQLGWSETMVVNGNVQYWEITNNLIHDTNNLGIDVIGFEGKSSNPATDQARDGLVRGNTVYNIDTFNNPSYKGDRNAACIYVDGGTRVVIEQNIGHHCNLGLELGSEHKGKSTNYITVRNNFFYNNTQAGIAFGGYDKRRGSADNNVIVNNTLYNNFTQGDWGAELYIQYNTNNNIVRNNIIYAGNARRFIESWSPVMSGNVVNNNQYFAAGGGTNGTWIWKNVTYTTFAAYQSGSGNDANGVVGVDPLFVSAGTGDLHLQSTSPAIDAGVNLPEAGTVDIDGQTRTQGPAIDRGADEVR